MYYSAVIDLPDAYKSGSPLPSSMLKYEVVGFDKIEIAHHHNRLHFLLIHYFHRINPLFTVILLQLLVMHLLMLKIY